MIRVYLADDEPLVLIGMRGILDWPALGYEIVGTASNGADALRDVEALHPDIVITDIMMPLMDGLELAETCRKKDPTLPVFIILTSYEQVDYMKRSIRFGAVEYLNKMDLTAQSLTAALERARKAVEKEMVLRAPAAPPAGSVEMYRERFFLQLYGGFFTERETFDRAAEELSLRFDAPCYTVALAELQCSQEETDRSSGLSAGVTGMAAKTMPRYMPCWVTGLDLRHFSVLVPLQDRQGLTEQVKPVLEKTGEILYKYFSTPLFWVVGPPVTDILQADRSQQAAMDALPLLGADRPVCFCPESPARSPDSRTRLVAQAQEYIRRNLDKRLSLNDVAAAFNFSPNYLSQMFSQNGRSFVEFVTDARIGAAKNLMASTDMKIYEISERVGFESAFYFSKVFKKLEGVSPREYMKKLRDQTDDT